MILTTKIDAFWRSKRKKDKKSIVLLSPYLTGPLANEILSAATEGRVYTLFDIELFASRASSLSVLKQLIEAGHLLFHLDDLHAKIVIDPNAFVTFGSQNVTSRGARNLELSTYATDKNTVLTVHRKIEPWLKKAYPITIEMVVEMEALLGPLVEYYDTFQVACKTAQIQIDDSVDLVPISVENANYVASKAKLKAEIIQALETAPVSQEFDRGTVKYREYAGGTSLFSESKNLLAWTVNGATVSLSRLSRYLCVTDTGEIGWARVAQTRISMIGQAISFVDKVIAEHPTWRIKVESSQNHCDKIPGGANIIVTVMDGRDLCTVPMRFAFSSYRTFSPRPILLPSGIEAVDGKNARTWIRENTASFEKQVINRITKTFKYGSNLYGGDAKFFGKPESWHTIRVALIDGNPILVVKAGYWS